MSEPITHDEVERLAKWLSARAEQSRRAMLAGFPDHPGSADNDEAAAAALRSLWARTEQKQSGDAEIETKGTLPSGQVAGHIVTVLDAIKGDVMEREYTKEVIRDCDAIRARFSEMRRTHGFTEASRIARTETVTRILLRALSPGSASQEETARPEIACWFEIEALTSRPPVFRAYTEGDYSTCGYCHEPIEMSDQQHHPDCRWLRIRRIVQDALASRSPAPQETAQPSEPPDIICPHCLKRVFDVSRSPAPAESGETAQPE